MENYNPNELFEFKQVYYDLENGSPVKLIQQYVKGRYFDKWTVGEISNNILLLCGYGALHQTHYLITELYGIKFKKDDNLDIKTFHLHPTTFNLIHNPQLDSTSLSTDTFTGLPMTSFIYDVYVAGFPVFRFIPIIK